MKVKDFDYFLHLIVNFLQVLENVRGRGYNRYA